MEPGVTDAVDDEGDQGERRPEDRHPEEEASATAEDEVGEGEERGLEDQHGITGGTGDGNAFYDSRKTPFCQCKKAFFLANISQVFCL